MLCSNIVHNPPQIQIFPFENIAARAALVLWRIFELTRNCLRASSTVSHLWHYVSLIRTIFHDRTFDYRAVITVYICFAWFKLWNCVHNTAICYIISSATSKMNFSRFHVYTNKRNVKSPEETWHNLNLTFNWTTCNKQLCTPKHVSRLVVRCIHIVKPYQFDDLFFALFLWTEWKKKKCFE